MLSVHDVVDEKSSGDAPMRCRVASVEKRTSDAGTLLLRALAVRMVACGLRASVIVVPLLGLLVLMAVGVWALGAGLAAPGALTVPMLILVGVAVTSFQNGAIGGRRSLPGESS